MINIVVASHREDILQKNIAISPAFTQGPDNLFGEILTMRGFTNIPDAYNVARFIIPANYVMYVHEDVFLPEYFFIQVNRALQQLPDDWAVLGVAGVKTVSFSKKECHGYILDRGRHWGNELSEPVEVDTLDELLLITRGDIAFDRQFPLDFYGADICMQAKNSGRKVFVIPGFCHHNSTRVVGGRTQEFYEARERFRNKWQQYLPIATTCTILS